MIDMNANWMIEDKYILRDGKIFPCKSWDEWVAFWTVLEKRRIAITDISEGVDVSTVFTGRDQSPRSEPGHVPVLFETLVSGGPHSGYCERFITIDDAKCGHQRIVDALRRGRYPGDH